mgnify:FL=1
MEETLHCGQPKDREVDPEVIAQRRKLFDEYVMPFLNMVYSLTRKYSSHPSHVQENYTQVLSTLYRGINTYNPERPIRTWLHICTKRKVFEIERNRNRYENSIDDSHDVYLLADDEIEGDHVSSNAMCIANYRELYNDDILAVIDSMTPIHRDALLLQLEGHSLKEIAEIERKKGTLESGNIDTIKSRLFLARQKLKKELTRDGIRRIHKADEESPADDDTEDD